MSSNELVSFLEYLRQKGFFVSIAEHLMAQELLLETDSREQIRRYLQPLLCKSPLEQASFGDLFDEYFDPIPVAFKKVEGDPITIPRPHLSSGRGNQRSKLVPLYLCLLMMVVFLLWRSDVATVDPIAHTSSPTPSPTATANPKTQKWLQFAVESSVRIPRMSIIVSTRSRSESHLNLATMVG